MAAYAIWCLGGFGQKNWWAGTVKVDRLSQAEDQASEMMRDKDWFGVGVREDGQQAGNWKYCDFKDGPTDRRLLKPRRKKEPNWPKLPMEITA